MGDHRYTFVMSVMVDASHEDENRLIEMMNDDSLENIISDAIDISMEMHDIEGEVYHVHVHGDPHSEELG